MTYTVDGHLNWVGTYVHVSNLYFRLGALSPDRYPQLGIINIRVFWDFNFKTKILIPLNNFILNWFQMSFCFEVAA